MSTAANRLSRRVAESLEPLLVPIDSVNPYPGNPNVGDVEAIAASLLRNTQYKPIVIQNSTGYIIAGNHTWLAAQSLTWPDIAAIRIDVDDETARRILAVDNRSAQLAHYDDTALLELLQSIAASDGGLDGSGWAEDDLQALLDLNTPTLTGEELAGKHNADPDDPTFAPRIDLTITTALMDAWREALDHHDGDDDVTKLSHLLDEVFQCRA